MKTRFAAITACLLLGSTALSGAALAQSATGTDSSMTQPGALPHAPMSPPVMPGDPATAPMPADTGMTAAPTDPDSGGRLADQGQPRTMGATEEPGTPPMPGDSGSPANTATADGAMSSPDASNGQPQVLAEVNPNDVSGSERQKNAVVSTQLLNRFNTLGFAEFKEFSREGSGYKTEARTNDGNWVTVMIDPEEGTITQQ